MAEQNRDEIINDLAGQMASLEIKKWKDGFGTSEVIQSYVPRDGKAPDEDELWENIANGYGVWIRNNLGVSGWDDATAKQWAKANPEDLLKLYKTGRPAEVVKRKVEYNAFSPLFDPPKYLDEQGNEQTDPDWYNMGRDQIAEFAKGLGFNLDAIRDRKAFYSKLREHATEYEKSKAVADYAKEHPGEVLASSILTPTTYKLAMEQALTDRPISDKDKWLNELRLSSAIDGAALGAMLYGGVGGIRGAAPISAPLADGASNVEKVYNALRTPWGTNVAATTGAETLKQAAGSLAFDQDFSVNDVATALMSSMVVPASSIGIATKLGKKASEGNVRKFAREFAAGARGMKDPAEAEKDAIVSALLQARKNAGVKLGESSVESAAERGIAKQRENVQNMLMALGYGGQKFDPAADIGRQLDLQNLYRYENMSGVRPFSLSEMMKAGSEGDRLISDEQAVESLRRVLSDPRTFETSKPNSLTDVMVNLQQGQLAGNYGRISQNAIEMAEKGDAAGAMEYLKKNLPQFTEEQLAAEADKIHRAATEREKALASLFPKLNALYEGSYQPLATGSWQYRAGQQVGPLFASIEAATKAHPIDMISQKLNGEPVGTNYTDSYKRQSWYKKLPENKRKILEDILKRGGRP